MTAVDQTDVVRGRVVQNHAQTVGNVLVRAEAADHLRITIVPETNAERRLPVLLRHRGVHGVESGLVVAHVENHVDLLSAAVGEVKLLEAADRPSLRRVLDGLRLHLEVGVIIQRAKRDLGDLGVDVIVALVLVIVHRHGHVQRVVAASNVVDLHMIATTQSDLLVRTVGTHNDGLSVLDDARLLAQYR